jgi:hypothetical protein
MMAPRSTHRLHCSSVEIWYAAKRGDCKSSGRAVEGRTNVIEQDLEAGYDLGNILPEGWEQAAGFAVRLADETRYLPWPDRASTFDRFVWQEARAHLAEDDVTAIVNRQNARVAEPARVDAYARHCRAVLTATLLLLEDQRPIDDAAAALVHFFSLESCHQEAAVDWIGTGHEGELASGLPAWPGFAFLLLVL